MLRSRSAWAAAATRALLAGEQRLRAPLLGEGLDADRLDAVGERIVGAPARLALGRVGESRARADEDQALDETGQRERGVERDPAAHRVAGQREALATDGARVRGDRGERGGAPLGRLAVAREVRRHRAIASAEFRDGPPPALARLRESV